MTFSQSVILLLMTALLTGLLVPIVKGHLDDRKLDRQKALDAERRREEMQFAADLARQSKVLEDQAHLLDELAASLWEYQNLLSHISYYAVWIDDEERHRTAFRNYDIQSWTVAAAIRGQLSKARRLVAPALHAQLSALYDYLTVDVDRELLGIGYAAGPPADSKERWRKFDSLVRLQLANRIDDNLRALADELRLSKIGDSTEAQDSTQASPPRLMEPHHPA